MNTNHTHAHRKHLLLLLRTLMESVIGTETLAIRSSAIQALALAVLAECACEAVQILSDAEEHAHES